MNKIKVVAIIIILILLIGCISYAKLSIEHNIVVAQINIDKTKPIGNVSYSTKEPTSDSVKVKIKFDEKINRPKDWKLLKDGCTITKLYNHNIKERLTVTDLADNKNVIEININNIRKK